MNANQTWAVLVGARTESEGPPSPIELVKRVADEVRCFEDPADALEGLCAQGESPPGRRFLFVVDQRGKRDVRWTSLAVLAHLAIGPVILLVDEFATEVERRARRLGIGCLNDREISARPGVLVRAARRALSRSGNVAPLAPAVSAVSG